MNFADYARTYLDAIRGDVKPSTAAQYEYLAHMLDKYIGKTELDQFDTRKLQWLADALAEYGMKKRSVSGVLVFTRMVLRHAMKSGETPVVVFDKIRNKAMRTYNDRPCLNDTEFAQLVGYCNNHPQKRGSVAVMLALYAGLRIGEIAALQWDDVSISHGIITVKRTRQRIYSYHGKSSVVDGPPKSATSRRIVPVAASLRSVLESCRNNFPQARFVASSLPNGTEPRQLRIHMEAIMEEAGIEKINPHALRHTFISRAINGGGNIKAVSELAGHADAKITLNIYTHASETSKKQAVECIDI